MYNLNSLSRYNFAITSVSGWLLKTSLSSIIRFSSDHRELLWEVNLLYFLFVFFVLLYLFTWSLCALLRLKEEKKFSIENFVFFCTANKYVFVVILQSGTFPYCFAVTLCWHNSMARYRPCFLFCLVFNQKKSQKTSERCAGNCLLFTTNLIYQSRKAHWCENFFFC